MGDVEKEGEKGAGSRARSIEVAPRRGVFYLVTWGKASISLLLCLGKSQGKTG